MTKKIKFSIIAKKGVKKLVNMQDNKIQQRETQQKTIRMDIELIKKVEELGRKNERNFSKQVQFMLRKYIEITENN